MARLPLAAPAISGRNRCRTTRVSKRTPGHESSIIVPWLLDDWGRRDFTQGMRIGIGLLGATLLLTGCFHHHPARNAAPPPSSHPRAVIKADLQTSGQVAMVNAEARFVVLSFPAGAHAANRPASQCLSRRSQSRDTQGHRPRMTMTQWRTSSRATSSFTMKPGKNDSDCFLILILIE